MSYLALYRKYRSQNFDEVFGQEAIIQTLKNSLEEGKIAHAYLFSGPRGTGKTSVARLLAKALNCEKGMGQICGVCDNCKEITTGNSPDVIEIDAASNSGVDEVRNIVEKVKYSPVKSRYKVYIIDEVHMMSNSAFNALLKTLEEPPEHVIFILCTTELYKVLPTILSRCQRYEFKKLTNLDLKKLLIKVLTKEGISYEEKAVEEIVELANGGARDALSLLDQVISFSGSSIHTKNIEDLFGIVSKKEKIELLEYVKNNDPSGLLRKFNDISEKKNIDVNRLVNDYLKMLKEALISSLSKKDSVDIYITMINKYFTSAQIKAIIDVFIDLSKELKITNNASLLLELYLLKLIDAKNSIEKIVPTPSFNKAEEKITPSPSIYKEEIKAKETKLETPTYSYKKETPKEEVDLSKKIVDPTPTTIMKTIDSLPPIFEDEKKESTKKEYSVIKDGDSYHLSSENLIKLSVLSNKTAKRELAARWNLLKGFTKDAKLVPYVELLENGVPYLLTDKFFILMYNVPNIARLVNIKANQEKLQLILEKLIGKKINIYALDRVESTNLVTQYRNLEEVKRLPKTRDLNINDIEFE